MTMLRRFAVPLIAVLALVVTGLVVRNLITDATYKARVPNAMGIRAGDSVRIAGLTVGTVRSLSVDVDEVVVSFTLHDGVELTDDTTTQVKLASLLGQRYLALDPGDGAVLEPGDTLPVSTALDTYSIERFFLDVTPELTGFDLDTLHQSIAVLTQDLSPRNADVRDAMTSMAQVSAIVAQRDEQVGQLLTSTRQVTDTVIDQQDELDALMHDAVQVLQLVYERREALRLMLRDSRTLAVELTAVAKATEKPMTAALSQLQTVLTTLRVHKAQLDEILKLSGPTMRVFNNGFGDGPWLGVNAPNAIIPDDLVCTMEVGFCK